MTFENQDIEDNNSSQILRNNDPVDVGLMKWFSVKFLWFISKFNITFAAAQFILALIYSLLVLLSHPVQDIFPATLFRVRKLAQVDEYKHTYHRFIVCPNNSCNTLYTQDSSLQKCSARKFNKQCGEELLYQVQIGNKVKLCPYKVYHYQSPIAWVKNLMDNSDFIKLI